jgi:hypothetical protein
VWSRDAVISVAEPGSKFSFETIPARGINNSRTVWTYDLTSLSHEQTRVVQRFDWYAPRWIRYFDIVLGRPSSLRRNVTKSLQNLKVIAEQTRAVQ